MGKVVKKIVLTGGPCAGKTTALSKIEKELTEKGYKVLVVGESATELIKGGIRPFGDSVDLLDFQKVIFGYQLDKEKTYENAIKYFAEDAKCVIIYDRGIMDNKAYISNKEFDQIMKEFNLKPLELMDNYDMVIHLVTAADGKEEYYTLANNEARTETVEEAKKLDKKTRNAWVGHSNLQIIDNSTEFEEKLQKVVDAIDNLLGHPISIKSQRRYLIDLTTSDLSFLTEDNSTKIEIEQTYLNNSLNKSDCEVRLRKRTLNDENTYYFTTQKKEQNGLSKVVTEKKIKEKDYLKMLSEHDDKSTIKKTRWTFIKNKQYFRLDIFEDGMAILEVDPTDKNKIIKIPKELIVQEEITNDHDYDNYNLACRKNNKELKRVS